MDTACRPRSQVQASSSHLNKVCRSHDREPPWCQLGTACTHSTCGRCWTSLVGTARSRSCWGAQQTPSRSLGRTRHLASQSLYPAARLHKQLVPKTVGICGNQGADVALPALVCASSCKQARPKHTRTVHRGRVCTRCSPWCWQRNLAHTWCTLFQ